MWTLSDSTSLRALVSAAAGWPSLSSRMTSSLRPAICQPASSQNSSHPLYMSLPAWAMAPDSGEMKPRRMGPCAAASGGDMVSHDATARDRIGISTRMRSPPHGRSRRPRLAQQLVQDSGQAIHGGDPVDLGHHLTLAVHHDRVGCALEAEPVADDELGVEADRVGNPMGADEAPCVGDGVLHVKRDELDPAIVIAIDHAAERARFPAARLAVRRLETDDEHRLADEIPGVERARRVEDLHGEAGRRGCG